LLFGGFVVKYAQWLSLDDFYEVEIHQAAVECSLGLDASELALLLLSAEKIVEAVALVEGKVALLVVGIDEQEATAGLVERVDEPGLDEAEHLAAEVAALEIEADSEAANHHGGVAAVELLAGDVALDLLLARAWYLLDAVVGKGEGGDDGGGVVIERKTIVLAKQLVALQERVVEEKLVEVVVTAAEGLACVGLLAGEEPEAALVV